MAVFSIIIFLLIMPIPTPASVWGGPVDCIGGPVVLVDSTETPKR